MRGIADVAVEAFTLLFGLELKQFAGILEGAIIGTEIGVAMAAERQPWHAAVIAAVLGLLTGAAVAWPDNRLMAASLQELVLAFLGSRLQLHGLSNLLAERVMFSLRLTASAMMEGGDMLRRSGMGADPD